MSKKREDIFKKYAKQRVWEVAHNSDDAFDAGHLAMNEVSQQEALGPFEAYAEEIRSSCKRYLHRGDMPAFIEGAKEFWNKY